MKRNCCKGRSQISVAARRRVSLCTHMDSLRKRTVTLLLSSRKKTKYSKTVERKFLPGVQSSFQALPPVKFLESSESLSVPAHSRKAHAQLTQYEWHVCHTALSRCQLRYNSSELNYLSTLTRWVSVK